MLDFLLIATRTRKGVVEIYPKFRITNKSKDLMIRAGDFYAIWVDQVGLWSTNEDDAILMIDGYLDKFASDNKAKYGEDRVKIMYMWDAESNMIDIWHKYCQKQLRDNWKPVDETLIFMNQKTSKNDYGTKRLNYSLDPVQSPVSWNEMLDTLYSEEERHKIEWCIGCVISGDSKRMQKFAVLYGPPGSGKSTILNVIELLFAGYTKSFDAKSLGSNDSFSLEQFKTNPLVAISHDGDLSKIENNTKLNSLVSHEKMPVNEKHKSLYEMQFVSFLFMGTNSPVKITNAKSGLMRRLIDIHPSGNTMPLGKYNQLVNNVNFELGSIAQQCLNLYLEDTAYYKEYRPTLMMSESNDFYNFVSDAYTVFKKDNNVSLKVAWEMYKTFCDDAKVPYPMPMRMFKNELKNYFKGYDERRQINGMHVRSYYFDFKNDIFETPVVKKKKVKTGFVKLDLKEQPSNLDILCAEYSAQYGTRSGTPKQKWSDCTTILSDLDTTRLHYLKVPDNLIVIDFDIQDKDGNKNYELNAIEASKWPVTYTELSKSGGGIHLHYIYDGDPTLLSRVFADNIEIKVFTGNSSLRRKLTKCNNEQINRINSGLPLREVGRVVNFESIKSEKAIRSLIMHNLNKDYHAGTKPSMDFIFKILEDAYNSGLNYDVEDLHGLILAFAANSSNQSEYCLNLVPKLKFKSKDISENIENKEMPLAFFDVEIFPNLFILNWKLVGVGRPVTRLINPTPQEVEQVLRYRLIGFNCRRYDNHIMYGALIGYSNIKLYELSKRMIDKHTGFFREAYNLSYTDIYDYATEKMSLKKWEIRLKIKHQELGLPWDKPVPEELWVKVAEYCDNDVIATEAVFNSTAGDFRARQMLVAMTKQFRGSHVCVNDKTNTLTTKLIFGEDKTPALNYVDLSETFPGYKFVKEWDDKAGTFHKANMYHGIDLGFGGYVYSEPGIYNNVVLMDVTSMHPNSAINMNYFGKYTPIFAAIVQARVFVKNEQFDEAAKLFDGVLEPFLKDESLADDVAQALKIAINSVYGLTSASFINAFKDPRNENNIVALRGALFMKTLQDELVKKGFQVIHVKTDSIKVPNMDDDTIQFCHDFAAKYGYTFAHEATYERICLVNDAVYIAKYDDKGIRNKHGKHAGEWTATGTQFKVPYVFKKLFSHEPIVFDDLTVVKQVKSSLYLNMNENSEKDDLQFIGRVGNFCPIQAGHGGGELVKPVVKKDGTTSYDSVTGAKGYRWMEAEMVEEMHLEEFIDVNYYNAMVDKAVDAINAYGDSEWFTD